MLDAIEKLAAQLKALDEEVVGAEDSLFLAGEQSQLLEKETVKIVAEAAEMEAKALEALSEGSAARASAPSRSPAGSLRPCCSPLLVALAQDLSL